MEGRQFNRRTLAILVVLTALLLLFFGVLYNLQVLHVDDYRAQSVVKIANRKTVEAARGELLDRYGRSMVTNRATYQLTLNTGVMGEEAVRNANLLELLNICRDNGLTWTDTLAVSTAAPFTYTSDTPLAYEKEGGGVVVVESVKTGEILTMASYPTYDLSRIYSDITLYNQLASDTELTPLLNRATQEFYYPGSTFKPLVAIAALEEGLTTPTEKIQDTGRLQLPEEEHYPYGDFHPQCWIYRQYGGNHGWEDLADALRDSCNIYFYTMGHRLGIDKIDEYASLFGLGEYTGIELPEVKGYVAGPATSEALGVEWYGGNLLNAAIGQDNTQVTPLQLANYIVTLLNGGDHFVPHLLKSVKSSDYSETVYEQQPEVKNHIALDPANVEAVKRGMWEVANDPKSTVDQYLSNLAVEVGAKTGSAQVGSADKEADAVFTLFAPYDDPEIVISIVVEGGASGGNLAQAAGEIVNYYFSAEHTVESVDAENTLLR